MPVPSSPNGFLPNETDPKKLLFYPKLVAIYDITFQFINRYLDVKDRTRDQMLQSARSGKQNIIEGAADGLTSSKMELSLTNCSKGSLRELQADYEDYLRARGIPIWGQHHPRTSRLQQFCRSLTNPEQHIATWQKMDDEELANLALTLIHQSIYLIEHYIKMLEQRFITQGGISEAMTQARRNHRHF
ncbi:MAG: four helix bundle suffix domain-containing protein [Prevotella sp.]|nr:four helix bundle suffix domain-containing protein [Prevotella sp.]